MNSHIPHWLKAIPALLLFLSFLPGAEAAQARPAKLSVEYVYAPDGTLAGRTVNGQVQRFEYDKRGQLLAVKDSQDNDLERYVYDPAGNILSKTVHGKTTRFTYDAANQITSRTNPDGSVVQYRYDAAGRLVQEGTRSYVYGYQDKVEAIRENGKTVARFAYGLDGQLESVTRADGSVEHFYWDGLALIGRGKSTFLNEPYMTGGNPIVSDGKAMLNDMLGSTVGIRDGEKVTPVAMTAFGESADQEAMYTGKPHVDGLGYAFLFRNYRAELGKWQSADPIGYPDGWNQMAYCNNGVTISVDWLGAASITINAACAGTGSSSGGGSSGGVGSTSGGWGHSWFDLTDSKGQTTGHGFYPNDPAGYESVLGYEYGKVFSSNDTANYNAQKIPYASITINITDDQVKKIQSYIDKYDKNWSLYNNCTDYVMDALKAAGIDISSYNYTTAGVADPDKLYQTILNKGGRIRE